MDAGDPAQRIDGRRRFIHGKGHALSQLDGSGLVVDADENDVAHKAIND